jgi:NAD(P)-dependent dehydrogenase (short-subunit alcohol dehydrogenase family)
VSLKGDWALVLGASSGFGEATSLELARRGMNIIGVHLDRKGTMPNVERIVGEIKKAGCKALFHNVNAADEAQRKEVLDAVAPQIEGKKVRVMLHSLAFGALKPFFGDDIISKSQIEMTLDVMAHSLVYWTQDLHKRQMLGKGSRIFAMTSSGSERAWFSYGAVSAAKAALESHIRQIAVELAPMGVSANAIRAGVTDTPSARKIPGIENMMKLVLERNPSKRLTTPEDVARLIASLSEAGLEWTTGNVINCDGGEIIV